ncbi:topless-related protein 4-like [Camellia sinensis]|uniref:topless-related protein 4-like n=1 Tax=Camellia sinensis TaxID=4442 RepID=UPI00103694DE|nr:topless-related protein 4-like [Camellia sinensis]
MVNQNHCHYCVFKVDIVDHPSFLKVDPRRGMWPAGIWLAPGPTPGAVCPVDIATANEEVNASQTAITQLGDDGDVELVRPTEEPSVNTIPQPDDAITELGITDQPAPSDTASPRGKEVEPLSTEPATGIILQPGDSPMGLGITDQLAESGAESPRGVEVEPLSTELEAEQPNNHDPVNLQASQDPSDCVAYSKHIVHLYTYHGGEDIRNHLEIDAHTGNVSDLAFCHPNKQLCVITCGEDKTIKVWDVSTGSKQYTFEGHQLPVYSVCPHTKENIQVSFFSSFIDGKIKAWLYDNLGSRADYDAPGHSCTTMAYSADGTRLFSCGTSKEGESYIVEWNESEGAVKRTYHGLRKRSVGVMQFDTTKDRFLAAGDEFVIRFWDMDIVNLLTTTDAEGGLPASPCIRFNKEGTLLAISTSENGVKILANSDGVRLLHSIESRALDASRMASESAAKAPIIGTFCASSSVAGTNVGVADRNAPAIPMITLKSPYHGISPCKPT